VRFAEVRRLLESKGYLLTDISGSHQIAARITSSEKLECDR